jgi:hypothetical protein
MTAAGSWLRVACAAGVNLAVASWVELGGMRASSGFLVPGAASYVSTGWGDLHHECSYVGVRVVVLGG